MIESEKPREDYMQRKLFWRPFCVTVSIITALVFLGRLARPALGQVNSPESDIRPFAGTWTAVHAGTPIIVLHLRSEKGELVGGVQVCSFSVNTESSGAVDVVTDSTLSETLPIHNVKISGRSIFFDWKDPDGDDDHWRLELTGKDAGQITWVGLSSGLKAQPIPVNKNVPKSR
jgi:hypothetical protein